MKHPNIHEILNKASDAVQLKNVKSDIESMIVKVIVRIMKVDRVGVYSLFVFVNSCVVSLMKYMQPCAVRRLVRIQGQAGRDAVV